MRRTLVLALGAVTMAAVSPAVSAPSPRPGFTSHVAPAHLGNSSGEPTLGVNPETGAVLFQAGLDTLRVTFSGKSVEWTDVSALVPSLASLDPIVETDVATGRHFVSQLTGGCSNMAYSDDDGGSWTHAALGCAPGALFDHQSVGTGTWRPGGALRAGPLYPNPVYYCAHDGVRASCGVSIDGGLTFGPGVPAYTYLTCNTNFGHLKSAPDGTVYLPPQDCDRKAGVVVSENNGQSWTPRSVPGSSTGNAGHPSVGIGADGTAYFAWGGGDGAPYASVTRDRGATWTAPYQLGREFGVTNTKFVTTVAGDGDRAAVAYLGSRTGGNDQNVAFAGAWHLYVSFTYDRGKTWTTVNATPSSPVQVGSICMAGIGCLGSTRNLLDFNDVAIDRQGKVLVAIADGCVVPGCGPDDRARKATLVRQSTGRGLLRAYDAR